MATQRRLSFVTAVAVSATLATAGLGFSSPAFAANVAFPDAALQACVNGALGHSANTPIRGDDAAAITELVCTARGIANLTGIQSLTHLQQLDLSSNRITDLQPLTQLTGLVQLDLAENEIVNTLPLAPLIKLQLLSLDDQFAPLLPADAGAVQTSPVMAPQGIVSLTPYSLGETSDPITGQYSLLTVGIHKLSWSTTITIGWATASFSGNVLQQAVDVGAYPPPTTAAHPPTTSTTTTTVTATATRTATETATTTVTGTVTVTVPQTITATTTLTETSRATVRATITTTATVPQTATSTTTVTARATTTVHATATTTMMETSTLPPASSTTAPVQSPTASPATTPEPNTIPISPAAPDRTTTILMAAATMVLIAGLGAGALIRRIKIGP
jgi:hypothetical protein